MVNTRSYYLDLDENFIYNETHRAIHIPSNAAVQEIEDMIKLNNGLMKHKDEEESNAFCDDTVLHDQLIEFLRQFWISFLECCRFGVVPHLTALKTVEGMGLHTIIREVSSTIRNFIYVIGTNLDYKYPFEDTVGGYTVPLHIICDSHDPKTDIVFDINVAPLSSFVCELRAMLIMLEMERAK
jgi:hypothetical protein